MIAKQRFCVMCAQIYLCQLAECTQQPCANIEYPSVYLYAVPLTLACREVLRPQPLLTYALYKPCIVGRHRDYKWYGVNDKIYRQVAAKRTQHTITQTCCCCSAQERCIAQQRRQQLRRLSIH
jgi:hypothetical protein